MNRTLDPSRTSWLESANSPSTDFPIQNLPFGVFRRAGTGGPGTIGVAIGDDILDVGGCQQEGAARRPARAGQTGLPGNRRSTP